MGLLATATLAAAPIGLEQLSIHAEPDSGDEEGDEDEEAPAEASDPLDDLDTTVDVDDWERLADCESGDWAADGEPQQDSARWDYGLTFDHGDHFQGGLNFHPDTWDAFRDPDMPAHAGRASPPEEIEVAERVLDEQGWDAWPVCSRMMDLDE